MYKKILIKVIKNHTTPPKKVEIKKKYLLLSFTTELSFLRRIE